MNHGTCFLVTPTSDKRLARAGKEIVYPQQPPLAMYDLLFKLFIPPGSNIETGATVSIY